MGSNSASVSRNSFELGDAWLTVREASDTEDRHALGNLFSVDVVCAAGLRAMLSLRKVRGQSNQ